MRFYVSNNLSALEIVTAPCYNISIRFRTKGAYNMKNKEYLAVLAGCEEKYDSLYRGAAAAFGLSDCSMWVLYYR